MNSQKTVISETQMRKIIRNILLEVKFVDEYLLGKKFSFTDGGEPSFFVVAENIPSGQSLISRYSKSSITDFSNGLKSLSGPGPGGTPDLPSPDLLDKISQEQDGWKVWDQFKTEFENDKNKQGNFFLIDKKFQNFRPPVMTSSVAGQEKFSKFECTLRVDETARNLFSSPSSQEFMLAAACSYGYANSWRALALAAAVGAIIGGYAAGVSSATLGAAVTAPAGGEGAVPAGAVGTIAGVAGGAWAGASLGAASSDAALRIAPLLWSIFNKNYSFAAANAIVIFFDVFTFGKGKAAVESAPLILRTIKGAAQLIFEFISPMAADASIQVDKDRFTQSLQDMIDSVTDIKSELAKSEDALKTAIRFKYPDF